MALTRWDPFTALAWLDEELARLDEEFDEIISRTWGAASTRMSTGYVPAVDMYTDGPDVVIRLELPGVDVEDDVDIEVAEGRLTISGRRRDEFESREESGKVLVRELRYGSFRRDFALPEGVTADDIEATYDRGMLEVRVRNVTRTPAAKKIPIRTAREMKAIEAAGAEKKPEKDTEKKTARNGQQTS